MIIDRDDTLGCKGPFILCAKATIDDDYLSICIDVDDEVRDTALAESLIRRELTDFHEADVNFVIVHDFICEYWPPSSWNC